jgi:hypothetical protein
MNAIKLPFVFDAEIIKKELSQFTQHDYYDIYNTSVTLETLWSKHFIEPIIGKDGLPVFLPNDALKKCPYLLSVLETFKCDKETFRVHTLNAGASIKPHRDIGYSLEHGKIRIHIPIITNDKVEILLDKVPVHMSVGETWYCNFHITHEVHNKSNASRMHLIMDCLVNDWVKDVFKQVS